MELTIERISPKKAREILSGNDMNRNLRPRVVKSYARDMVNGKWTDGGDPIRINCDDNLLLDGQHRLHAIIESGKTVKMVVARGVPKIAMLNIDTGAKRQFADNLRLLGYKNVMNLSSAIRFGTTYDDPEMRPHKDAPTYADMMEWFKLNPLVTDDVDWVVNHSSSHPVTIRIRRIVAFIRSRADRADFELFWHGLRTGEDLSDGSPILALRRFIENELVASSRRTSEVIDAVVVKAWNAFLEGESVHVLRHRAGGAKAEPFPTILIDA